jgi:hypothetical protein
MLSHPHPIHTNISQHRTWAKNFTYPIPTRPEKQPKPKNQPLPQPNMGWGISKATHPHKKRKSYLVAKTILKKISSV